MSGPNLYDDPAALHALAQEVARAMGSPWAYAPPKVPEGERVPWFAEVRHPEGYGLHLSSNWSDGARVRVSGTWPRTARGETVTPHIPYGSKERDPEITLSATRGAEAIAREVARRLLPDYLPKWEACLEQARRSDEYAAGVAALLDRLARVVGVRLRMDERDRRDRRGFVTRGEGAWVDVEAYGPDSVTLKFQSLPPELAERLLSASGIQEKPREEGVEA